MILQHNALHSITKYDDLLKYTKALRNFNVTDVYNKKLDAINDFFREEKLDSAVVGLSGGLDSSLVLMLLLHASAKKDSPIKVINGCFMPIYSPGITGQDTARMYVDHLNSQANKYTCYKYSKLDLSPASMAYRQVVGTTTNWHIGQIDSIVRTPALYGMAAKLQTHDFKSIVVGTTNRDEGAYIGFFGKASDGMVDLQPIADLHKSEVKALASLCNVPDEIINRPPMGDVWDAKVDEEMFGATYEILEMFQILLENDQLEVINNIEDKPELIKSCLNIIAQHKKNAHKYYKNNNYLISYGYGKYLDVMQRNIKIA